MKVTLRPWVINDASFVIKVRNIPALKQWFRQDHDLTLEEQEAFMNKDSWWYGGNIIEADDKRVGICNLSTHGEFGIAVLPEYQGYGIATKAMNLLLEPLHNSLVWSEVFVKNPALSWYLHKLKFKAVSVKERAYYKKDIGMIDIVRIERLCN